MWQDRSGIRLKVPDVREVGAQDRVYLLGKIPPLNMV